MAVAHVSLLSHTFQKNNCLFNASGVAIIEHFKFLYQLLSSQCAEVPALIPVTNQVNFEVGHLDVKQFLQGRHGKTVWVTYTTMVQSQLGQTKLICCCSDFMFKVDRPTEIK